MRTGSLIPGMILTAARNAANVLSIVGGQPARIKSMASTDRFLSLEYEPQPVADCFCILRVDFLKGCHRLDVSPWQFRLFFPLHSVDEVALCHISAKAHDN